MANRIYKSINGTATTQEQIETLVVYNVKLIKNDDIVGGNDLHIAMNDSASGTNYIVLKPGEFFKDFSDDLINYISYKSSSGSVPFRFVALTSKAN